MAVEQKEQKHHGQILQGRESNEEVNREIEAEEQCVYVHMHVCVCLCMCVCTCIVCQHEFSRFEDI